MRRALLVLSAVAALAAPPSARAAVTPDRDAPDVAAALSATGALAASTFAPIAPAGNPAAISDGPLGGFPTNGAGFAVLSSGDALRADPANEPGEGDNGSAPDPASQRPSVYDLTTLRLDLRVPEGVNCAVFSFRFLTDEAPGSGEFNDGFIAELDSSNWIAPAGDLTAPNNFAFDTAGNVISVNSPGSTGLTEEQATGTGFTSATAQLTAATPITAGAHSLYLSIFDQGDDVLDSAVFLDGLDLQQRAAGGCIRGAQDEIAPDEPDGPDLVPEQGKTVVVGVVSGIVRIKGRNGKFRRLRDDEAIPLGSTVDATNGRVHIISAAGGGKIQAGDFYRGMFVITQTRGAKPITQLALVGKLSCAKKGKQALASAKRKKVRRLWGDGKGRFRTKGRHGAATVKGTKWLTEDRCGRTKVTVKRGTVVVRDFAKRKNKVVKRGHSYVARG